MAGGPLAEESSLSPTVRSGLVQCSDPIDDAGVAVVRIHQATLGKHLPSIERAAAGLRLLGRQEIFNGPYSARGRS